MSRVSYVESCFTQASNWAESLLLARSLDQGPEKDFVKTQFEQSGHVPCATRRKKGLSDLVGLQKTKKKMLRKSNQTRGATYEIKTMNAMRKDIKGYTD